MSFLTTAWRLQQATGDGPLSTATAIGFPGRPRRSNFPGLTRSGSLRECLKRARTHIFSAYCEPILWKAQRSPKLRESGKLAFRERFPENRHAADRAQCGQAGQILAYAVCREEQGECAHRPAQEGLLSVSFRPHGHILSALVDAHSNPARATAFGSWAWVHLSVSAPNPGDRSRRVSLVD